jgi:hypothetical protein
MWFQRPPHKPALQLLLDGAVLLRAFEWAVTAGAFHLVQSGLVWRHSVVAEFEVYIAGQALVDQVSLVLVQEVVYLHGCSVAAWLGQHMPFTFAMFADA